MTQPKTLWDMMTRKEKDIIYEIEKLKKQFRDGVISETQMYDNIYALEEENEM